MRYANDFKKVKEKSINTSLEQEIIDQYYDYIEYGNVMSTDAVYMVADDFGFMPAKIEMILRKNGINESEEKDDEKKGVEEEEDESKEEKKKKKESKKTKKEEEEEEEEDSDDDKEEDEPKEEKKKKKESTTIITMDKDYHIPGTDIILEKGEVIEVLKEDYGWEIQRGKEFAAFEDALEVFGAEEMAFSLAKAMSTKELGENLSFMFRNWDYQSPYLS